MDSLAKIKISTSSKNPNFQASSPVEPSPYNSPSLVSPSSSAFVSALQSPYISPRAITSKPADSDGGGAPPEHPSSEDLPSSSYTPPSDHYEFSDEPTESKVKFLTCTDPARISFTFPVPRMSFAKCSVGSSPAAVNTKLRSCDVFVGFHGQSPNLTRFCKWLKSELEIQGIACFVADRAKYADNQSHEIADRVICSVTFGIIVITNSSFSNSLTMEEIRFFSQKKNLIPIFFDTENLEKSHESKEAIDKLIKNNEYKLEANDCNWRSCITKAATILRSKLGRTSVAEKELDTVEEIPFLRNRHFVGREREMTEIEAALFGYSDNTNPEFDTPAPVTKAEASGQSEGLADEESEGLSIRGGSRFISLEISGKCKEPKLEAWVEPVIARNSLKRTKYKKSKSGSYKSCLVGSNVICLHGLPGIGKTELALEFAYRYSQRYKMVLWVGGESRYLRQNILNLSLNLGLDLSADAEKERGRIRSFDEQELEAFKRVKRELFRDMPYLLIIDNLESDNEWWDGKDLHDLIPRNTGGSHVIITTRLSKVMNYDIMQIPTLSLPDSMVLMKGRRKREYPSEEIEVLKKFDEKLGRVTFGLCVVGSLLSELGVSPSGLFEEVTHVPFDDIIGHVSANDEQFCKNNRFLMKLMMFCYAILQQESGRRNLVASRMLLVGSWFAPSAVSATLLATSAKSVSESGGNWMKRLSLGTCLAPKTWKTEEESAALIVKLGLARRANKAQPYSLHFHPITRLFAKMKEGSVSAKAMVQGIRKTGTHVTSSDHLWASAFLVFGFKSEPPLVQLKAVDMVLYIKKTALPLAIRAFTGFSRCNSSLELLKVCTNVLEEVEKSFVSQIQDWCHGSLCWKKSQSFNGTQKVDEYVWQDVTLLKATLLETRSKLLLRGGHFDSGEELCRTCISIRTVMLGHNHPQTLAAQETLAKLVRMRSKI